MRASAPLLTVVGTAVGAVAAVVAYQAGAGGATETVSSGKDQVPETTTVAPTATKPTFLPCEKGTKLRKGVCVKVKKKVVVVYDPAPVVPAVGLVPARTGHDSGHESGDDRTRARPESAEHAGDEDRDEAEHSDDHESEDNDEVEDHHDEDTHEDTHEAEPED